MKKEQRQKKHRLLWLFLLIFIIGAIASCASDSSTGGKADRAGSAQEASASSESGTSSTKSKAASSKSKTASSKDSASAKKSSQKTKKKDFKSTDKAGIASSIRRKGKFSVTMLNVGQGLSILVKSGSHYMLYDGGGRSYSSYVVSYLKRHGITKLDYIVASHYDEDHINGLVGVLNTCRVKQAILPDYQADTKIYASLKNMVRKKKVKSVTVTRGDRRRLGKAKIKVLNPTFYDEDEENNSSIVLKISYGRFSVLLMGDAETEAEESIMGAGQNVSADLLVVAHHGSDSSTSASFIRKVDPSYVFVSVGAGNSYGHPGAQTMRRIKASGAKMFRSDKQGEVTVTYNAASRKVSANKSPSKNYKSGSASSGSRTSSSSHSYSSSRSSGSAKSSGSTSGKGKHIYILNISSGKFHLPDCSAVRRMSDSNKQKIKSNRKSMIRNGYSPCQLCNP